MFVQLKSPWKGRAIGERLDVSDDDAELLVKAGLADKAPNVTAELISEAVAKTVAARTVQMSTAMDAMLKEFVKAAQGSHKNSRAAIFGPLGDGDVKSNFGTFLIAVKARDVKSLEEMGSRYVEATGDTKAAMNTQTGEQGGFTVPTQFMPKLMQAVWENSLVRKRVGLVVPMKTKVL